MLSGLRTSFLVPFSPHGLFHGVMTPRFIIDLTGDDLPFDPNAWIGLGIVFWPDELPPEVIRAFEAATQLPHSGEELLPSASIPVTEFVKFSIPAQSQELASCHAATWFSSKQPTSDALDHLVNHPAPRDELLETLDRELGQAWLDGRQSIEDRRYPDIPCLLPLWAIAFWRKLRFCDRARATWRASVTWLERHSKMPAMKEHLGGAYCALSNLGWNSRAGGDTALKLAVFLSSDWLSCTHVDWAMSWVDMRAKEGGGQARFVVGTSLIGREIMRCAKDQRCAYTKKETPCLYRIEKEIQGKDSPPTLLFPVCLEELSHWVAVAVDFENKAYRIGKNSSL